MAKGKQTCKILKEIRKQIAADNDIELVVSECTYQGDCLGTCPKCEAEVRYLERELEKRQRLGRAAVFAGMSLGTLLTAAACDTTSKVPSTPQCPSGTEMTQNDSVPERRLEGDVVAVMPEPQEPDTIEEPVNITGIVYINRYFFSFDAETYQSLLKNLFVYPKMKHLSVVGGEITYDTDRMGKDCESLEELVKIATVFSAPYYSEGEQKLLTDIVSRLKVDVGKYKGDMKLAFTVTSWGEIQNVEVVKGIDKVLDEDVADVFKQIRWEPAYYQVKDGDENGPIECRCMFTIHFPIK